MIAGTHRRVCAWCDRDMGPAPEGTGGDTHGICPPCAERVEEPPCPHKERVARLFLAVCDLHSSVGARDWPAAAALCEQMGDVTGYLRYLAYHARREARAHTHKGDVT